MRNYKIFIIFQLYDNFYENVHGHFITGHIYRYDNITIVSIYV